MWDVKTGWACWPVRERSSWERFSLSHATEVLHLCGGTVDPQRDFVHPEFMRRATARNAHMRMRSHWGLNAHMQQKATDISRRKDRWGGNGSKSRRVRYIRRKHAGKATTENGIHFSFPIVICWQKQESVRDRLALMGLIEVRDQSNWALSSENITYSQRECF